MLLFTFLQSNGQINCSYALVKDTMALPGPVLATATETSPWPVTQRKWTLTTCSGATVYSPPAALNANFAYVPGQPGCYCLRLWSQNSQGDTCTSSNCNIFIIDTPKVNTISVTPSEFCPPQTVTLTMQNSAGCGQIDSIIIDWGCGNKTFIAGNATTVTHTYTDNCFLQCYDVNVKLVNSCGAIGTKRVLNAVCLTDVNANFTASNTTAVCANSLSSTMIADSTGAGVTYCWYVNNVQMQCSNSRLFTHIYPANTTCYSIKLVVSKPTGCVDSMIKQNYVCAYTQPELAFSSNSDEVCIDSGQSYTFCLYNTSAPYHPSPKWQISGPQGFSYGPVTGDTVCFNTSKFGNYSVTMMGDYGVNCKDTIVFTNALKLKQNPTPCFYASDTFNCQPTLTTQFTNCSSAPPGSNCTWNFGYGASPATSTLCNPGAVAFNSWGSHTISLTSTTPEGCSKTLTKPNYIKIDSIHLDIGVANNYGCAPKYVILHAITNSMLPPVVGYLWQIFWEGIQIGTSSSAAYPQYCTYNGCYTVRLTAWTADGCTSTVYKDSIICLGIEPSCNLSIAQNTTCYGSPTVLNVFGSSCNYDTLWVHYGDEVQPVSASAQTYSPVTHLYNPGIYNAWVVPSLYGCSGDTLKTTITILPPLADFTSHTSCLTSDSVFFQNTSVGANRYHWQVNCTGDTFNTPSPRLLLPHCDTCRISLTAYNDTTGCRNTKEKLITTACNSVDASFSHTPPDSMLCGATMVKFFNTTPGSNNGVTIWDWSILVGGIVSDPAQCAGNYCALGDTVSRYLTPGRHQIIMVYVAPGGCKDTVFENITVCDLDVDFTPTQTCLPDSFKFNPIIIDPIGYGCDSIVSYEWTFDNGSVSTSKNPIVFLPFGIHSVSLTVTNASGCSATVTKNVTSTTPVYDYIEIDTNICPGSTICITNLTTSGANMVETWQLPGSNVVTYTGHTPPCLTYNTEGEYQITYVVTAGTCNLTKVLNMHVHSPLLSGSLSANYAPCPNPPLQVCAVNTSQWIDTTTDQYTWNFGVGESNETNPCVLYTFTSGCYPVTLSVITDNGCTDTVVIDTVCIGGPRVLYYNVMPTSVCVCQDSVHYEIATVDAIQATFLSGCNQGFETVNITPAGTLNNPAILRFSSVYCLADSCLPQISLRNANGCQTFLNLPRVYIDTPVAKFGINSPVLCSNNEVCFTDSSFNYVAPTGDNWLWNFGDANDTATSNLQHPCHTYSQPGTYTVTLIAKPNSGCADTFSRNIVVLQSAVADFSYVLTDTCKQSTYCFTDVTSPLPNTSITNRLWCNGSDCIASANASQCFTYDTESTYPVTLYVTDSRGCVCETTQSVLVNNIHHLEAIPSIDVIDSCTFSVICLVDSSVGESAIVGRTWYYSGNSSTNSNICYTVSSSGIHDIRLVVTDAIGCKDTTLMGAQVAPYFTTASFYYTVAGNDITFHNQSTGYDSQTWLFGDNNSSTANNPTHYYNTHGTYQVTLIVSKGGCVDSITLPVIIDEVIIPIDTICGIVYVDVFGNGQYDSNTDIPLSGRLVTANAYSSITNSAGYYEFHLPSGSYALELQATPNIVFTQPVVGYYNVTTSDLGQKLCNYNFGIEDTTTAVVDYEKDIKLTIIPNPFSEYTSITINTGNGVYGFGLYNTIGELVAVNNIVTGQPLLLQRNELPPGVYLYAITKNNFTLARGKLVIE